MFYKVCQGFIKYILPATVYDKWVFHAWILKVEVGKHFVKISNHLHNKNPYRLRSLLSNEWWTHLDLLLPNLQKDPWKLHLISHIWGRNLTERVSFCPNFSSDGYSIIHNAPFWTFTLQLVPLLDEEDGKSQHYKLLKKRKIRSFFFTCEFNLLWQHVCVGACGSNSQQQEKPLACKQHKLWTGPVLASYQLLDLSYGYQKSIFQKTIQGRICISKNNSINYTRQLHIHYKNYWLWRR